MTKIGVGAFKSCKTLEQVIIPNSVTSIGKDVFKDCPSLQRIIISTGSVEKFKKMLDEELWDELVDELEI